MSRAHRTAGPPRTALAPPVLVMLAALALLVPLLVVPLLGATPARAQAPGGVTVLAEAQMVGSDDLRTATAISGDGSTVVFVSEEAHTASATTGTTIGSPLHVFAVDVASGAIEQVDVLPNGRGSDEGFADLGVEVSHDGRYVLFASGADDLDPAIEDGNGDAFLYLRDREAGTTRMVTVGPDGPFGIDDLNGGRFDLSGDGSVVAYSSVRDPFGVCGGAGSDAVYLYRVEQARHVLVSATAEGCIATTGGSSHPSLSHDGDIVAFQSRAESLAGVQGNGSTAIWVADATTGDYVVASQAATADSTEPSLSADGSTVAFTTQHGYVGADTDFTEDIYVLDIDSGHATLASPGGGQEGGLEAGQPHLSPSGRYVSYWSEAEVAGPQEDPAIPSQSSAGIYRHDLSTGQTLRMDLTPSGAIPTDGSIARIHGNDVADDGSVAFPHSGDQLAPPADGGYMLARGDGATGPTPDPDPDPEPTPGDGLDGPIATAIEVSQARFGEGGLHGGPADYAVLATAENFADALSGAVLAQQGPLLLTRSAELDPATRTELDRTLAGSGTVYVLGGEGALSAAVTDDLTGAGYTVRRLQGASRFETSTAIAAEARARFGDTGEVALARAFGPEGNPTAAWADSVTGGAWAAGSGTPIVLTPSDGLHPAVESFLDGDQAEVVHLLGGTAALSGDLDAIPGSRRTAGATRFDTARQIASGLWDQEESGQRAYLVIDGTATLGWAYGLPAAGLAADVSAPVLATGGDQNPPETLAAVAGCGDQVALVRVGPLGSGLYDQLDAQDSGACS